MVVVLVIIWHAKKEDISITHSRVDGLGVPHHGMTRERASDVSGRGKGMVDMNPVVTIAHVGSIGKEPVPVRSVPVPHLTLNHPNPDFQGWG
jgi:hypothetical protein